MTLHHLLATAALRLGVRVVMFDRSETVARLSDGPVRDATIDPGADGITSPVVITDPRGELHPWPGSSAPTSRKA